MEMPKQKCIFGYYRISIFHDGRINTNINLPSEILDAVKAYIHHNDYASMTLCEYLNKVFEVNDYNT